MVSKCANPACSATFRYLHDGTLFHLAVESASPEQAANYDDSPRRTLLALWQVLEKNDHHF